MTGIPSPGSDLFSVAIQSLWDVAAFALDPDGYVTGWNAGAKRLTGYSAEEITGSHFSCLYPGEEVEVGAADRALRLATRGELVATGAQVRRDGSRFPVQRVIWPIRDDRGELVGYGYLLRDLSELQRLEDERTTLRSELDEIQEIAHLGAWEWDMASDRVTWSRELYRIYALEPEEFAGSFEAFLERVHPEDRKEVRRQIEAAYTAAAPFDFEERIVRPDGEIRLLRTQGRVEADEQRRAVRLVGTCLDITDQKRAEAQAREVIREQALRTAAEETARRTAFLAEASRALATTMDYEITLQKVARLAVPAFADWCVVRVVRLSGGLERVAVAHTDPERIDQLLKFAEEYPDDPTAERGVYAVVRSGRPEFFPELSATSLLSAAPDAAQRTALAALQLRSAIVAPLAARSGVLGTLTLAYAESERRYTPRDVALAEDLGRRAGLAVENARLVQELQQAHSQLEQQTRELAAQTKALRRATGELQEANEGLQRKTLEAEQARQLAEEASRAKSQFLANMSHELRTPLNAIAGYADLMVLGIHGEVSEAQQQSLERIKRNQRYLLRLINDLLNFARLEAGQVSLELSDVPLAEVLQELEPLIGSQVQDKGLDLDFVTGSDLLVRADRERLDQILLNLISNAIKFTPAGGEIRVWCEPVAGIAEIHVGDTGIGIPAEKQTSIFEPFVQVDARPGRDGEGVGLGLAISRELARAMGGDLTVASAPGEGSVFTLSLPVSSDSAAGEHP